MKGTISSEYFSDFLDRIINWSITELPQLLIFFLIIIILLRIFNVALRRVAKVALRRSSKKKGKESEKRINTLIGILRGIFRVTIWAIFFITFLKKVGIDIGPILASAGIIGLAVGFGAQELVRDFISGFFVLLEDQVRNGDVAIINGTAGVVESIEMRTITLRDFSGVVHIFQHGKISSLSNMTKEWSAMAFDIGVAYKEDVDRVTELMKQTGEELMKDKDFGERILELPEVFGLDQFGDSAVVIKARIKTAPGDQWAVGREYRRRLKKVFDQNGIEIPFPHTTIYWGEDSKPALK